MTKLSLLGWTFSFNINDWPKLYGKFTVQYWSVKAFDNLCSALPSLDCKVPYSADAMSLSRSTPHPLSTHDWDVISNTNNLHCIWKHTGKSVIFSCVFMKLACMDQMCELLSPATRCSQTPLLSWLPPALINTSAVCVLRVAPPTPPETLSCCHLQHIKTSMSFNDLVQRIKIYCQNKGRKRNLHYISKVKGY